MRNSIFKGTAHYYSIYRPGIPGKVIEYIAQRYGLNGKGVLLDMGCGTGQSTFALAPLFKETVAFDIDAEMLAIAKQKAPRDLKIEWQQRSEKDISGIEGPYRLAVACRSFHWMDQYPLLKKLHNVLESGGGVVIVGDGSFWTGGESWQKKVKEVIQSFLGQERRAGQLKYRSSVSVEPFSVMLENSNFLDVQCKAFPIVREWNVESILGYLYSTSFSAKHLFGNRLQEFEDAIKEQLIITNNGNLIFVEHNEFVVQSGIRN